MVTNVWSQLLELDKWSLLLLTGAHVTLELYHIVSKNVTITRIQEHDGTEKSV